MSAEPILRLVGPLPPTPQTAGGRGSAEAEIAASGSGVEANARAAVSVYPPAPASSGRPSKAAVRRLRRVALSAWVSVTLGPLVLVPARGLLPPTMDAEWIEMLLVIAWVLVFPSAGLVLFLTAVTNRGREDARAFLAATASLVALAVLADPAADVAAELYVAAHAPEMECVANHRPPRILLYPGLTGPEHVREGALFTLEGVSERKLLYASPQADENAPRACRIERAKALGGRWFLVRCPVELID